MSRPKRSALLALALGTSLAAAGRTSAQQKPTLTPADYGKWESLGSFDLDATGAWLVAQIRRVDDTGELRLSRADGTGEPIVLADGSAPAFSADGRWFAYRKGSSPEEEEDADGPLHDRLGVVDLRAARDTVLLEARSFAFRDDGAWIAALGYAATDSAGADLYVMRPDGGGRTVIGNVDEYAWQDGGARLAATLRTTGGAGNGVVLFDPGAGTLRTLDSRSVRYRALTWRDESAQLGVLRSVASEGRDGDSHDVLVWRDVAAGGAPVTLSALGRADLPDSMRVTEYAGIDFDASGGTAFVGVRPWERVRDQGPSRRAEASDSEAPADSARADGDDVKPANVQIWHWNDDQIIRGQEYAADRIARRTLLAAWHLGQDRLVVLGDELDEPVRVLEGGRWGLVPDYDPYHVERRWGDRATDWYRVDVHTGERALLARGARFGVEEGPHGSTVVVYEDEHWSAVDLASLQRTALAGGRSFTEPITEYDYPGPRPPWGFGGWVEGRRAVLLYDEHDVWRTDLDGGAPVRLTRGADEGRSYRVMNMDPDAGFGDPTVVRDGQPWWLSVRHPRTKESGYARLDGSRVTSAVYQPARVTGLTRAHDADVYAFRQERWDDPPDVFVGDARLEHPRQVTRTNPFQGDYAWGRSELLDYTTDAGQDLQAILVYPAGFEEGRRYPLILYQYERLSDNLHRYEVPSERDYYDFQAWSQEGYFVLMPDIVYEPGRPGPSALDAVEHALDAAVATGYVDPDGMGLIGHSWGGYQAAYLPTRTNRFAASVAGAAITDFVSFMGAIHWNGGNPETSHWEMGQARMAVPFWEDPEGHLESSPVNFIQDLETPVLLMHGDADGTVDFRQGLEYYNYARRAGKEVVLLVYPGSDHGIRDESQQVDYHRRILQWFGHYLKGEPAAEWITDGETWVEREKRIGG